LRWVVITEVSVLNQVADRSLNVWAVPFKIVQPRNDSNRRRLEVPVASVLLRREESDNPPNRSVLGLLLRQEVSVRLCPLCLVEVVVGGREKADKE